MLYSNKIRNLKFNNHGNVWLPVITIIVGVSILLVLYFLPKPHNEPEKTETPPINVNVMEVKPVARLQETMTHKAVIEPWAAIVLSAETSAAVTSIEASQGDMIKTGQVLVRLNDDLLKAACEQARQQADLDQREAVRMTTAAGSSTASEKDAALSNAAASKAALKYAEAELAKATIAAPSKVHDPYKKYEKSNILGRLESIAIDIGEYVQPGTEVAYIINSSALKVILNAPERDIQYIHVGDEVEVVIEALDDKIVTGIVHHVLNLADKETLTYVVEIAIDNPDGMIKPGMFARVTANRRLIENAVMIPLDAAIPLEKDYEVYILEDGVARRRFVGLKGDLVRSNADGITEILTYPPQRGPALKSGDLLIIRGQRMVADGQKVVVQQQIAE